MRLHIPCLALVALVLPGLCVNRVATTQSAGLLGPSVRVAIGGAIGEQTSIVIENAAPGSFVLGVSTAVNYGQRITPLVTPAILGSGAIQNGRGSLTTSIPNAPALVGMAVYFHALLGQSLLGTNVFPHLICAPNASSVSTTALLAPSDQEWSAAALGGGRLLVTGGQLLTTFQPPSSAAAIYDFDQQTVTPLTSLTMARYGHASCALRDGSVLIVGGTGAGATAELFQPTQQAFVSLGAAPLAIARPLATSVIDPRTNREYVLIADTPNQQAMLYDAQARTFSTLPSMIVPRRPSAQLVAFPSGHVAIFGGRTAGPTTVPTDRVELFDLASRQFYPWGQMASPRSDFGALRLDHRYVLLVGGQGSVSARDDLEVFDVFTQSSVRLPNRMLLPRQVGALKVLAGGRLAVFGSDGTSRSPEILSGSSSQPMRVIPDGPIVSFRWATLGDGSVVGFGAQGHRIR